MIEILHGPDAFLVASELRRLRAALDPDGLNATTIDARSARLDEITTAVGTPGFFGAGRVIVIHDLLTTASKSGAGAAEESGDDRRSARSTIDWQTIFAAVEPSNTAVFVDAEIASVPAAAKRALPSGVRIFAGDAPRGAQLLGWIKERAKWAGASIADPDARFLAEALCPKTWAAKPSNPAYDRPPDLQLFASEIEKLALASDGTITRATIESMTSAGQPDSLFPLVDAFVAGDVAGAMRELRTAIEGGEEMSKVFAQLTQQIELMAAMSEADGSTEPPDLGKALALSNPNRMYAVQKSLARLRTTPRQLVGAAIQSERALKRGMLRRPADQVYHLLDGAIAATRGTREGGN